MKKTFALLLALAMVFSLMTCLNACGEDETPGNTASQSGNNGSNDNNSNAGNNDNNQSNNNGSGNNSNPPAQVDPADFTKDFSFEGLTLAATAEYEKTQETPSMMEIESESISIWVQSLGTAADKSLSEIAEESYQNLKAVYDANNMGATVTYSSEGGVYYYTVSFASMSNGICTAYYQAGNELYEVKATYGDAAASSAEAQYIVCNVKIN